MNSASLHKALLTEIEASRKSCMTELEYVENVFRIALNYWNGLKEQLRHSSFESQADEIDFYKNIKPRFTCYIEYVMLINHSLLFVPVENKEAKKDFWESELQELNRFNEKNAAFVDYYKNKRTHHDHQYFLRANYDTANLIVSRPYDIEAGFMTSHDHLVAAYLAQLMYNEYVKEKLADKI